MIDFTNNTDESSRQLVANTLSAIANEDGFSDSVGNCVWDLSCTTTSGKRVSVEVKDRYSVQHDQFGDIFCENAKSTYTQQNYNFDVSLVVNVFKDGYIGIANLYDKNAKVINRKCPKETWPGGDHTLVWKECLSLPALRMVKIQKNV